MARPVLIDPPSAVGASVDGPLDPEAVVRACVRTLVGLASRTPGFDVRIGVSDQAWALRLQHGGAGLRAQLTTSDGSVTGPGVTLTPDPAVLDAELAGLTRLTRPRAVVLP